MACIEPPHGQVVQHMGLPADVPELLEDAQRGFPVFFSVGTAQPSLHEVQHQVRPALRFQLIGRLCLRQAALRPSASIRVATLIDPAERVLGLQLCSNSPCLGTCQAANSTQADTRSAECIAVMPAPLLHHGLLECQMSLPERLAAYIPQSFLVCLCSLCRPTGQRLCVA